MAFEFTYRPLNNLGNYFYFKRSLENPSLLSPDKEIGCFLVLQTSFALHETVGLPPQSLEGSCETNQEYISSGCAGNPPLACYPIYLITVGDDECERLVYIGKTSSKSSRFAAGHSAITKLHHPMYNDMNKRVYLCCVVFLRDGNEIPIEWIQPYETAEALLKSFEANLIYHAKPELNTHYISNEPLFEYGQVHVQNVTGDTEFWHVNFM
ncbi:hypothetical protein [Billgrantia bachuensis]|uniref:GIY-YIG domain-containing protein n=1 Tax=Billgrantia bachuensis TaxID=2717286 RepID=A0ABX0PW82_9GAMM|nr:hypothetical protein [Halomonas bachuensis]NIC06312.1 hypothetical protein [Halomonas bachuensis]